VQQCLSILNFEDVKKFFSLVYEVFGRYKASRYARYFIV
jgi:hypothetical protein